MSNTYGCAPQVAGSAAPSFIVGSRISCVWIQDGCCDKVKAYKKTVTDAVGIVTVSYFDAADCVTPIVGPVVEVSDPTIPDVVAAVQALASANSGPAVAADPCCPATNALLTALDLKMGAIVGNTDQLETLQAGTTAAVNSTIQYIDSVESLLSLLNNNTDNFEVLANTLGLQTDQLEPLLTDIKALLAKEPDCNNEPALRVFDKCVQQALLQVIKNTADDIIKGCLPAQTLPTVLPQRTVDVVRTKQLSGAYVVTAVYETVAGQMVSVTGPWPTLSLVECPPAAVVPVPQEIIVDGCLPPVTHPPLRNAGSIQIDQFGGAGTYGTPRLQFAGTDYFPQGDPEAIDVAIFTNQFYAVGADPNDQFASPPAGNLVVWLRDDFGDNVVHKITFQNGAFATGVWPPNIPFGATAVDQQGFLRWNTTDYNPAFVTIDPPPVPYTGTGFNNVPVGGFSSTNFYNFAIENPSNPFVPVAQRNVSVVQTKQANGSYAITRVFENVNGVLVDVAGPWPTLKIGKCPEVAIASTEPTADIVNCGTGKSLSVSECATSALTVSSQATTAATQSSAALLIQINNLQTTANNLQSGANLIATNAANSSANQNAAQLDELQAIKANTLATNLSVGSATSAQIAGNNLASVGQTATAAQATATQTILNEIKGFEQAGNAVDIAQNALVNAKLEQIRLALVATETLTATTKRTPSNPYTITANAQSYSVLAYSNDVTVSGSPIKQGTVVSVSVDRLQRIGSSANVTGADFLVTEIR